MNKKNQEEKIRKNSKRYNRILLLRYSTTGFFFANLYWFLSLILSNKWTSVIPLSLLIFSMLAFIEQIKFVHMTKNNFFMKKNQIFFVGQTIVFIVLFFSLFNNDLYSLFFPFLNFHYELRLGIGVIGIIGLIICMVCNKKIKKVTNN